MRNILNFKYINPKVDHFSEPHPPSPKKDYKYLQMKNKIHNFLYEKLTRQQCLAFARNAINY